LSSSGFGGDDIFLILERLQAQVLGSAKDANANVLASDVMQAEN
jgi:hypothetical protein